jgi:hypothetical protein
MADSEDKSGTTSGATSETTSGTSETTSETASGTSGSTPEQKTESKTEPQAPAKTESKTPAKTETKTESKPESKPADKSGGKRRAEPEKDGDKKAAASSTVNTVRGYVATAVWVLAVLAAVILAIGALVITLDFNKDNPLVEFFTSTANKIDFGVIKEFKPGKGESDHSARVKTVLVSWGIAALVYLVVGKVLERIIRP